MWPRYLNVTDGQMGRRTNCHSSAYHHMVLKTGQWKSIKLVCILLTKKQNRGDKGGQSDTKIYITSKNWLRISPIPWPWLGPDRCISQTASELLHSLSSHSAPWFDHCKSLRAHDTNSTMKLDHCNSVTTVYSVQWQQWLGLLKNKLLPTYMTVSSLTGKWQL